MNHMQGGFIEHVLTHPDVFTVVDKYLKKCKDLGHVLRTTRPVPRMTVISSVSTS